MLFSYKAYLMIVIDLIKKRLWHILAIIIPVNITNKDFSSLLHRFGPVGTILIVASITSLFYNILAGRLLGPSEYGLFVLTQSIAMIIYLPMLFGLNTALIKYSAAQNEFEKQRQIISTTFTIMFSSTIITLFLYFLFLPQLSELFAVTSEVFLYAIIFSASFVFYTITISIYQGLHNLKTFALRTLAANLLILIIFIICILFNQLSYNSLVLSIIIGYGTVGLINIITLKKFFIFTFDKKVYHTILVYGIITGISALLYSIFINMDKLLLNFFLSTEQVGFYGAYFFASFIPAGLITGLFSSMFFPSLSINENKLMLFQKLTGLLNRLIMISFVTILLGQIIILLLFGKSYAIDPFLLILFTMAAVFYMIFNVFAWFYNSEGTKGARISLFSIFIATSLNISLNIVFIPQYGVYGAALSLFTSYFVGLFIIFIVGKKWLFSSHESSF